VVTSYETLFSIRRLWIILAASMAVMFGTLLYFGAQIYQAAPPIPAAVRSAGGQTLFTRADIERGLAIFETVLGPDHVDTARARHTLASQLAREGRNEEALVEHHRAIAAIERGLGPDHPTLAEMLADVAAREEALGRTREAAAARERAAAIRAKHSAP